MVSKKDIVEKELGIPPDYQYKAITEGVWLQKNWHRNKFNVMRDLLDTKKSKVVLDLGTGSGNFEMLFSSLFKTIIGVDYNNEALSFFKISIKK